MVTAGPEAELVSQWHDANPDADRVIGQLPVCWDPDKDAAVERAYEQFRWFAGGWKVNAELPGTAAFAGATQFVRPEDVAEAIPCGPDAGPIIDAVQEYVDAGFTDVAVVQVGDESQQDFLRFAETELLPALRKA
jgi:G6PDH family F420-dependent oxidoreductase